jgi:hypothetical protein
MGGESFDVSKLKPKFNFAQNSNLRFTMPPLGSFHCHYLSFSLFLVTNYITFVVNIDIKRNNNKLSIIGFYFKEKKYIFHGQDGTLDGTVQNIRSCYYSSRAHL